MASWWIKELYEEARRDGWPCHREFAKELAKLMPRHRRWLQGKAYTFYRVPRPGAEVVRMQKHQGEAVANVA